MSIIDLEKERNIARWIVKKLQIILYNQWLARSIIQFHQFWSLSLSTQISKWLTILITSYLCPTSSFMVLFSRRFIIHPLEMNGPDGRRWVRHRLQKGLFQPRKRYSAFLPWVEKDPLSRDTHLVIINGAIICAFSVWTVKREFLLPIFVLSFYHFCVTLKKKKPQNQSSLTISWGLEGFMQFHEGLWGKKTSDEASLEKLEPSGV